MLSPRRSGFGMIKLQSAQMQGTLLPCFFPTRAPVASDSGYEHEEPRTEHPHVPACSDQRSSISRKKQPMLAATDECSHTPHTEHLNKSRVLERCTGNTCVRASVSHLPLPSFIFLILSIQLLVLVERETPGIHLDHRPLPASASSMQSNLSNPSPKFGGILPRALT